MKTFFKPLPWSFIITLEIYSHQSIFCPEFDLLLKFLFDFKNQFQKISSYKEGMSYVTTVSLLEW
jgi:hypothetical protein